MAANTNTKANSKAKGKHRCTYTATLFRVVLGAALLLLGLLLLLSCLKENQPGFNPFARFAWGLFGTFTFPFILLILWAGILSIVSAYHAVSWRGFVLMFAIVLFLATMVDLAAPSRMNKLFNDCNPMQKDLS